MNFKHLKGRVRFVAPVAYFSNIVSILMLCVVVITLGFSGIEVTPAAMVGIFCGASIMAQTYFFKIKHIQESEWVDMKWLKKEHKLKGSDLDQFARFNYAIFTIVKIFVALAALFAPARVTDEVNVLMLVVTLGALFIRKWLGKQGIIPYPAGFYEARSFRKHKRYTLDTANQLGSGITSYKWK